MPEIKEVKPTSPQRDMSDELWLSLTPRQQELVAYLKKNNKITRKQYADIFSISVPTAARDLKAMTDKNILEFKGPAGPGRYYVLKEGS